MPALPMILSVSLSEDEGMVRTKSMMPLLGEAIISAR